MLVPRTCRTTAAPASLVGFDRLLDDLLQDRRSWGAARATRGRVPAANSWEDETSYLVELDVPGLGNEDLEISVDDNVLEVSGGKDEETREGATWHLRERSAGRFTRKLRFPKDVDAKRIEARAANGVLTVTLPKSEAALPRKIEVQS